jgi:hypothetical protein
VAPLWECTIVFKILITIAKNPLGHPPHPLKFTFTLFLPIPIDLEKCTLVVNNNFLFEITYLIIKKGSDPQKKIQYKASQKCQRTPKMPGRLVPKSTIFPDDAICRKCEKGFQITWQKMTRPPGPYAATSQQSDLQETNR